MATTSGSLLPLAGGTIHAMSGGGYSLSGGDPLSGGVSQMNSLLPEVSNSVEIQRTLGGAYTEGGVEPEAQVDVPTEEKVKPIDKNLPPPSSSKPPTNTTLVVTNKPKRVNQAPLPADHKRGRWFGDRVTLTRPTNAKEPLNSEQTSILRKFGLESASPSIQYSVLTALFDGSCDTNHSLITMRSCEPFRQIVHGLAMRHLKRLNGVNDDTLVNDTTPPLPSVAPSVVESPPQKQIQNVVENQGLDEAALEAMEQQVAVMKEGLIPVLGITNPPPAVSCYCISTVQLLFSLPEFRSTIIGYPCGEQLTDEVMTENTTEENRPKRIVCALRSVFLSLSEGMVMMDTYQKPSEVKTISEDAAKRIQYMMRLYNTYEGQQENQEKDAAEFLWFIVDEIVKMEPLKKLYDYLAVYSQVFFTCQTSSGNQGGVPIQGKNNDTKVPSIILSSDLHMSTVRENPDEFKEDMAAIENGSFLFSVKSLIQSYEIATKTAEADQQCGVGAQGSVEKHTIAIHPESRYVFFEISKADEHHIHINPSLDLTTVDKKQKRYIFVGAIQYAKRDANKHYLFHLSEYSKFKGQNVPTIEGVKYVKYGAYGNEENIVTGANEEDYKEYMISDQARILVYRSEEAMDTWNKEVESKQGELAVIRSKYPKKAATEQPPQLIMGEPYKAELVAKVADSQKDMEVYLNMDKDKLFTVYDANKKKVDDQIAEITQRITALQGELQTYMETYSKQGSSDQQKEDYQSLELHLKEMLEQSELIEEAMMSSPVQKVEGQPEVEDEVPSLSTLIRLNGMILSKAKMRLSESMVGVRQTIIDEEEKSDHPLQFKWPTLEDTLKQRSDIRYDVMKTITDTYTSGITHIDSLLSDQKAKAEDLQGTLRDYFATLKPALEKMVEDMAPLSGEEEKEGFLIGDDYRKELLGNHALTYSKTGQEYYDQMVASEPYQEMEQRLQSVRQELDTTKERLTSLIREIEQGEVDQPNEDEDAKSEASFTISSVSNNPSEDSVESNDASTMENVEEAEEEQEEPKADAEADADADAKADAEAEVEPIVLNDVEQKQEEQQEEPIVLNEAEPQEVIQEEEEPAPIVINDAEQQAEPAKQQGGTIGPKQSHVTECMGLILKSHTLLKSLFDLQVDGKQSVIDAYHHDYITARSFTFMKNYDRDNEKNSSSSTMRVMPRLRRKMVRADVLQTFMKVEEDFARLVNETMETEKTARDTLAGELTTDFMNLIRDHPAETKQGVYEHNAASSIKDPFTDIASDPMEAYPPIITSMEDFMKTPYLREPIDTLLTALETLIASYNQMVEEKTRYEELPAMRSQIDEKIAEMDRLLTEATTRFSNQPSVKESPFPMIALIADQFKTNSQQIVTEYGYLTAYRSMVVANKVITIITEEQRNHVVDTITEINNLLQQWYDYFSKTYDTKRGDFQGFIDTHTTELTEQTGRFVSLTQGITKSDLPSALPNNYGTTYREELLGADSPFTKLVLAVDKPASKNKNDEVAAITVNMEQKQALDGILKEIEADYLSAIDEKAAFLGKDEYEFKTTFADDVNAILEKYTIAEERVTQTIDGLLEKQNQLREEEAALDKHYAEIIKKVEQQNSANKEKASLGSTDVTSLSKVIEEIRVRYEITEQYHAEKGRFKGLHESIGKQLDDVRELSANIVISKGGLQHSLEEVGAVVAIRQEHSLLKEEREAYEAALGEISIQNNALQPVEDKATKGARRKEEMARKIDIARQVEKLQNKINQLEVAVAGLEEEKAAQPAENAQKIQDSIEGKKARLVTLQERMAEQVTLLGDTKPPQKLVENTAIYPEKASVPAITEALAVDDAESGEVDFLLRRTKALKDHMETSYPQYKPELTADNLKALMTAAKPLLKEKGLAAITVLKQGDPYGIYLKAAVELGILPPEADYVSSFLKQDHGDTLFEDVISEVSNMDAIGLTHVPFNTTSGASNDILEETKDDMNRVHMKLQEEDLSLSAEEVERRAKEQWSELRQRMISKRGKILQQIIKLREKAPDAKKNDAMPLNEEDEKSTKSDYDEYRKRIDLLYALLEEPYLSQLIASYVKNHTQRLAERNAEAERERAEQERQEQERAEQARIQEEKKEQNYMDTKQSVRGILRDVRKRASFLDAQKDLPDVMKEIGIDLHALLDIVNTYSMRMKNAVRKNNTIWTTKMPADVTAAVDQLRKKYESPQNGWTTDPIYADVAKTVRSVMDGESDLIKWIRDARNTNRNENTQLYATFKQEEEQAETKRRKNAEEAAAAEQAKKEEEERRAKEEEERRLAAEKAVKNAENARRAKEKANRNAAIRAEKERIHASKLRKIDSDIASKETELKKIEKDLSTYNAIAKIDVFQIHYNTLKSKGKITPLNEKKVNYIMKDASLTLKEKIKKLVDILKDALNPDNERLQQEIKQLGIEREQILQGDNGDEKEPIKMAPQEASNVQNKFQRNNKKSNVTYKQFSNTRAAFSNLTRKRGSIEQDLSAIRAIEAAITLHDRYPESPLPNELAVKDALNIIAKYNYLTSGQMTTLSKQPLERRIQEIRDQLPKFVEELKQEYESVGYTLQNTNKELKELEPRFAKNDEKRKMADDVVALKVLKQLTYTNSRFDKEFKAILTRHPNGKKYTDQYDSYTAEQKMKYRDQLIDEFINELEQQIVDDDVPTSSKKPPVTRKNMYNQASKVAKNVGKQQLSAIEALNKNISNLEKKKSTLQQKLVKIKFSPIPPQQREQERASTQAEINQIRKNINAKMTLRGSKKGGTRKQKQ